MTDIDGTEGTSGMGNAVVHFEVMAQNAATARDYFSKLFGWTIDTDNPMGYGVIAHSTTTAPVASGSAAASSATCPPARTV